MLFVLEKQQWHEIDLNENILCSEVQRNKYSNQLSG